MDDLRRTAFLSPVVNRGIRKPFGEMTNTPPTKRIHQDQTTPKQQSAQSSSTPNDEGGAALTPMANLKLLMKVAAAEADRPSRRELFKDENDENSQHHNRLVVGDHDYSENAAGPLCLATNGSATAPSLSNSNNDSAIQTPTSLSSLSILSASSPAASLSSAPSSNASSVGGGGGGKVSRKDKSLGLLCDKFMSRFPREVPPAERCEIPLDDLARQMRTERRRIYDIVNVLEAVNMMTKVGKNLYQWHGTTHQTMTLAWLRHHAQKLDMLQRYHDVKRLEAAEAEENLLYGGSGTALLLGNSPRERDLKRSPQLTPGSINSSFSSCSSSGASPSPSPIERKTSLGVACQKFLMLFLIAPEPHAKINLDFAARVIHGIGLPDAIMKTRIRRLYDIANILQSLKLIQKVQITEAHGGRKPAFQYTGPDTGGIEVNRDLLQTLPSTRQRHSLLTFGKNLVDMPDDPSDLSLNGGAANRKRLTPDSGFGSTISLSGSSTSAVKRQFITLERSRSCTDVALNLTKPKPSEGSDSDAKKEFHFAVPRPALADLTSRRPSLPSVMDLSRSGERSNGLAGLRLSQQVPVARSLLQPPANSSGGVSLLKRALQEPHVPPPPLGLPGRSKTVITLLPPPGVARPVTTESPSANGVSITKVQQPSPGGLYRAATM